MKLNQAPNLRVEDFPDQNKWISKLFVQLNPFIQAVNQVFNQSIDYSTNIKAVTRSYTITTFQSFGLQWPFEGFAPVDLRITQAVKGMEQNPVILLPKWSYDSGTNVITVSDILEVSANGVFALSGRYTFTLRATI